MRVPAQRISASSGWARKQSATFRMIAEGYRAPRGTSRRRRRAKGGDDQRGRLPTVADGIGTGGAPGNRRKNPARRPKSPARRGKSPSHSGKSPAISGNGATP